MTRETELTTAFERVAQEFNTVRAEIDSIPDSASVDLRWIFGIDTTDSDPTQNIFKFNNADPALVTEIYVSDFAYPNRNVDNILGIIKNGDRLYIQQSNSSTVYINADLTGDPIDNNGYWTLPVSVFDSGDAFLSNQFCNVIVYHVGSGSGGGGASVETTNVANVDFFSESSQVFVSSVFLDSVQDSDFIYTPVSDNSELIIEYSWLGTVVNEAAENVEVYWSIGEGGLAISDESRQSAAAGESALGGIGIGDTQKISIIVPNGATLPRSFSLLGRIPTINEIAFRDYVSCKITEILPERIVAGGGGSGGGGGGVEVAEVEAIAAGSTLGLQQSLLANAGQPALTVLAVGFTNTGKVQGCSLGNGNVVEVYANGTDFNNGAVLYREFMSLGEPICFTGLTNGAIITSSQGFYGFSEQADGNNESPMPLLSYGLSFKETFLFAFRDSSNNGNDRGFIRVVNGPLKSLVSLTRGNGTPVNAEAGAGTPQTDIEVEPWGFLTLQTDGNTEFILKSTNPVMACIHAEMRENGPRFHDSRLIMPLTNDGITWPRSGDVSAPYNNTFVKYYVRDGAKGDFIVSPASPVSFDGATGANDQDYEPDGATRVLATGLISAYSGADSAGLEASPLMPTSAMSQVVAQPLFIADNGDGGNSSVAIASPFTGTAKIYEWDSLTSSLILKYTVPLERNGVVVTTKEEQNHPTAGLVANESQTGVVTLVGQLNAGVVIADVPITVVVQNGDQNLQPILRSQNGTTTTSIQNDDDETLSLGLTPDLLKAEIRESEDGILYRRVIGLGGVDSWVEA